MQAAIGQPGGGGGALLLRTFNAMRNAPGSYRQDSRFSSLQEGIYYI